ncbi:acyl carrier protein [Aetokthonos hydrillicola Thurmond2011]|jgi:acyl carrier protein|uniref:Acyl carrier protein n=1 Tax=Aetokthonos hydrillicola Thurmond2011 TaxID=2712845 RepID=A0AAP5M7V9_9CYAN|nr:acyl carrier protein [Aetokthonos hydrillicola]MBO3459437.1 acyl carrier protein [Aetokthonos hydrillicola CCALA 1050]MBW4583800.1 acyl carrier protein [Aetokthonos hydrillicola CCALA 1050]MDR9895505.1 acyl carrier protein [Aetokthonos hydrillicola Thurmond2011]
MKDIKLQIRKFLSQYFGDYNLQDDENIFSLGFVNSMFAIQLVLFIEKEFQLTVDNEDLEFENFKSINAIYNLLEKKSVMHIQT